MVQIKDTYIHKIQSYPPSTTDRLYGAHWYVPVREIQSKTQAIWRVEQRIWYIITGTRRKMKGLRQLKNAGNTYSL